MAKQNRQSTLDALNKFSEKAARELAPKKKRMPYAKPEKEVEKACLKWMRDRGFSVDVFEAKATYNPRAGAWLQQSMKAGVVDIMGSTNLGIMLAVELKAPAKLKTLRENQRLFLIEKIAANAFACVTDSVARLADIYNTWLGYRYVDQEKARAYLMSMLP